MAPTPSKPDPSKQIAAGVDATTTLAPAINDFRKWYSIVSPHMSNSERHQCKDIMRTQTRYPGRKRRAVVLESSSPQQDSETFEKPEDNPNSGNLSMAGVERVPEGSSFGCNNETLQTSVLLGDRMHHSEASTSVKEVGVATRSLRGALDSQCIRCQASLL